MFQVYSPYSDQELQALISLYLELKSNNVGTFAQLRLMDLDKNLMLLTTEARSIIFLYGFCNHTSRESAGILDIHHSTVIDKYNKAIELLRNLMNGEHYV